MADESPTRLSADRAIANPDDDRFGYAQLANHLADSICEMSPLEGMVLAIYGPWGSGKTTLLNLIVHYLQLKPESEKPVVVSFNPWWFSGQEDLTRQFFGQMQAILSEAEAFAKDLRNKISSFGEAVSEVPVPLVSVVGKVFMMMRPKEVDVSKLKSEIREELGKQSKQMLIVIDDIDRLTAEEIRQLFRLIKAVADFPNVVYLLAFDKGVVINALEKIQDISGEDYLEKIVQVPFALPQPDKTSLRQLFFERLDTILSGSPSELFKQTYWDNVYYKGLDVFITTPRDIVRLTNAISVTYPAVKGEVNIVDFIAIESLRVFCPPAYDTIRNNPWAFIQADVEGFSSPGINNIKTFQESWINQLPENHKEPIKRLLLQIFPTLGSVWRNRRSDISLLPNWRKHLRICCPDIFPVYFRLAVPAGGLSAAEINMILGLVGDPRAFSEKLLDLANQIRPDGTTRLRVFLDRLGDYTWNEIPVEHIPPVIDALFDIGDKIPSDQQKDFFDFGFGNLGRVFMIVDQLLLRLEKPERFKILKEAVSKSRAISTIAFHLVALGGQHGMFDSPVSPEDERLLSLDDIEEFEKITLEKIREAAKDCSLMQTPKLRDVLSTWEDLAGEDEVKQWINQIIVDDEGLAEFLTKFLPEISLQGESDVARTVWYDFNLKALRAYAKPSHIIDRARQLSNSGELTEMQKTAINHFVQKYESLQPKNPNT